MFIPLNWRCKHNEYTQSLCAIKGKDMSIEIVIYFSILFFLSELVLAITKHSKKKGIKIKNDKKSLILFSITIVS